MVFENTSTGCTWLFVLVPSWCRESQTGCPILLVPGTPSLAIALMFSTIVLLHITLWFRWINFLVAPRTLAPFAYPGRAISHGPWWRTPCAGRSAPRENRTRARARSSSWNKNNNKTTTKTITKQNIGGDESINLISHTMEPLRSSAERVVGMKKWWLIFWASMET